MYVIINYFLKERLLHLPLPAQEDISFPELINPLNWREREKKKKGDASFFACKVKGVSKELSR